MQTPFMEKEAIRLATAKTIAHHGDWHTPPEQVWPYAQTMPQPPQLRVSKVMFVQMPPQFVPPPGQSSLVHTPWTQSGADAGQTLPQAPQLLGSLNTGMQTPLQNNAP
jgi:hypothetical protein